MDGDIVEILDALGGWEYQCIKKVGTRGWWPMKRCDAEMGDLCSLRGLSVFKRMGRCNCNCHPDKFRKEQGNG